MRNWASRLTCLLAFVLGLGFAHRATAVDTFEAVLTGSKVVPGPGLEEGSFVAVVLVEGTNVSLTLPKEVRGLVSVHLHRGIEGVAGWLVAEFPWDSGDGSQTHVASLSARATADLVAHPGNYYVDVHTTSYPAGAARGQLAPHAGGERGRVEKKEQRIVGDIEPRTFLDPDFPLPVTATSGLDIVFFASGDCSVSGSVVHITAAGRCMLEAHQPGDSYYLAAPIVDLVFEIAKADQTIELAEMGTRLTGPDDVPLSAQASSDLPVGFVASAPCTIVGSSLRILDSGQCDVTAFQSGNRNFNPAPSVTRSVEVVLP